LALLAGCGTPSDDGSPAKGSAPAKPTAVVGQEELPKLGDPLPPLDGNRLELAPPEGWHVPSASREYVVRMDESGQDRYPRIIVTAEEYEGIANVSEANVAEFADQVAAARKVKSGVKPIEIGRFVGVAYAKRGKVSKPVTRILQVLYLETVVAGRKYRFELRCEDGELEAKQPYLFSVVRGTRFLEKPGGTKPAEQAAEPSVKPAEAKPTEAKPSEAKPEKVEAREKTAEKREGAEGPKPASKKVAPATKEGEKAKKKKENGDELNLDNLDDLLE
jgi:hypothetical protein